MIREEGAPENICQDFGKAGPFVTSHIGCTPAAKRLIPSHPSVAETIRLSQVGTCITEGAFRRVTCFTAPKRRPKRVWGGTLSASDCGLLNPPFLNITLSQRVIVDNLVAILFPLHPVSVQCFAFKLGRWLRNEAVAGASEALVDLETLPHATRRASKCSNHS